MSSYVIVSDSTLDLNEKYCVKYGVEILPMQFNLDGKDYKHYVDAREMSYSDFYKNLRDEKISTTSQINYTQYYDMFYELLLQGKDIIYISFSANMSGSYNTSLMAIADLKQKYPLRRITAVNSRSASIGEGLLVYNAAIRKQEGCSYEKMCEWLIKSRDNISHWFVVDDLEHLKRGGRITEFSANIGKLLQIKPLLTVDSRGSLKTVGRIRGLSKSLETLTNKVVNEGISLPEQTIIIGHADAYENAQQLKNMIIKKTKVKKVIISDIGPVIGSHVGSGMLGVSFVGEGRIK